MSQRKDSANLNGLEACLQAQLSLGTCGGAVAHSDPEGACQSLSPSATDRVFSFLEAGSISSPCTWLGHVPS